MRPDSRGYVRRGYTDLAVVVGHSRRDAEDLLRRIREEKPENLLGYDIYVTTAEPRYFQGLRVHDFFISKLAWNNSPRVHETYECLYREVTRSRYQNPHWRRRTHGLL